MMGIGPVELIIIALIGLGGFALPLATLVIVVLLYVRLRRIEEILEQIQAR